MCLIWRSWAYLLELRDLASSVLPLHRERPRPGTKRWCPKALSGLLSFCKTSLPSQRRVAGHGVVVSCAKCPTCFTTALIMQAALGAFDALVLGCRAWLTALLGQTGFLSCVGARARELVERRWANSVWCCRARVGSSCNLRIASRNGELLRCPFFFALFRMVLGLEIVQLSGPVFR